MSASPLICFASLELRRFQAAEPKFFMEHHVEDFPSYLPFPESGNPLSGQFARLKKEK